MNQLLGNALGGASPLTQMGLGNNAGGSVLSNLFSGGLKCSQNEQRLLAEKSQRNILRKYLTQATGDPIQSAFISRTIPGKGYGDTLDVGLGTKNSIMQSLGLGQSSQNTGFLSSLIGSQSFANQGTGLMNPLGGLGGNTGSTETTTSASGASTATKIGFTRVGEAKYGYIDVPTDWHKFVDLDADSSKLFQYSDALGQSIVTMSYYDIDGFDAKQAADNFYNNLYKDSGVDTDSITGAKVKLGNKYDAYQVYCYYSDINSFLVAHFFDGEDGYVHYVTFEGKEWETFELADTYSLTE